MYATNTLGHALFVNCLLIIVNGVISDSLTLLQIVYRHGDRTPVEPFPTDAWKDSWPEGLGELTNLGKIEQYELGKFIREHYNGFLNESYYPSEMYIRSSDKDRTLMSAYCNLAGLFPPQGEEIWNNKLMWQPIPVHTKPVSEDYELSVESVCPRYNKLLEEELAKPEIKHFNQKFKGLFEKLSNNTGWNVTSVFNVSDIYDTLFIEMIHNKSIPEWADNKTLREMKICERHDLAWSFSTDELRKLRGGPLLGEMVQNMKNKLDGKIASMKAFIYSGHDMTIIALLSVLGIFNGILPPYASMVMVELHKENNGTYVKFFYRNSTSTEPYELDIPDCKRPCMFDNFTTLVASKIPVNIKEECAAIPYSESNITLIGAIAGSILGCVLLLLIVAGYAIRRKNSTEYRYMNVRSDNI